MKADGPFNTAKIYESQCYIPLIPYIEWSCWNLTICIAIQCKRGSKPAILFASDTQETYAYLKRPTAKLRRIIGRRPEEQKDAETWGIAVATAGDSYLIDEVVQDLTFYLWDRIEWNDENPSTTLMLSRKEIGDVAYKVFKRHNDRSEEKPVFELLLGVCDKWSTILYVTCEGKTKELKDYGIIGIGLITGGDLLLTQNPKPNLCFYACSCLLLCLRSFMCTRSFSFLLVSRYH
jgi:hypothetical protein